MTGLYIWHKTSKYYSQPESFTQGQFEFKELATVSKFNFEPLCIQMLTLLSFKPFRICLPLKQGRIYVANEYPTFARTMLIVGQKLTFLRQITSNVRQNLFVLMKNMQIFG